MDTESDENGDLKIVENRLRTFDNWPVNFIDATELANSGMKKFSSF